MTSKSKKPAKTRTPTLIDGLTMEDISEEQLEERIVRLQEELERKERNYFQLERDKIHTFCGITERQVEEAKADHKNLDKEIEDNEERQQVEIKVYKQKMKRLLNEHQNTISELKANGLTSTDAVQKEQAELKNRIHKRMKDIRVDMQELDIENPVKELELKHDEEMTKTSNSWEVHLTEIQAKNEKKVELWQQELDNTRKNVTIEAKDFWNNYIINVVKKHYTYFINPDARKKDMEEDMDISRSLKEETEVKEKRKNTQKEAMLFCVSTLHSLHTRAKELADRKRNYEALQKKFSELQLERDKLYQSATQNIQKVQHTADLKTLRLSKRLKAATDTLGKTQAQLSSVFSASNMAQTALRGVTNKTEEDIASSKDSIKNLCYIEAKISKACKELLLTHEAKQRALGVPVEAF